VGGSEAARTHALRSRRSEQGFPKSATRKVILGAVELVISGGVYIPPQALPGQEQEPSVPGGMPQAAGARPVSDQRPVSPADLGLTERQMDVLTLIMQGKSNKAVSAILRARKRPGDGDLPEAPSPAVPPSPTRGLGPQGERVRIVPDEP
jgi:DNA-binding NarL/FixJ family response regulator